jgi:hypothetical protein
LECGPSLPSGGYPAVGYFLLWQITDVWRLAAREIFSYSILNIEMLLAEIRNKYVASCQVLADLLLDGP